MPQSCLAGLAEAERPGRPPTLNESQLLAVAGALRESPEIYGLGTHLWDGKTLSAFIKERFRVDLGVRQCQRLFRQLGFRLRKPRPLIAHADPEVQQLYKKLRDLDQNLEVELWAMDEVRFQQHGSRCRMWVPPETRDPVILHHPTHRSVGYFGAVRLSDGKFVFQGEETRFNAQTFLGFLQNLRLDSGETGRRVMVITDNARYHHAKMHQGWRAQQAESFDSIFCRLIVPK